MPTLRPYQMRVHTPQGTSSYIALAANGVAATCDALGIYPGARSITAKPVTTHRA